MADTPQPLARNAGRAVEGLQWASLAYDGPPRMGLHLVIQSKDAADAKAAQETLKYLLIIAGNSRLLGPLIPDPDALAAAITPAVDGNRLVLNLDDPQFRKLIDQFGLPALSAARKQGMLSLGQPYRATTPTGTPASGPVK